MHVNSVTRRYDSAAMCSVAYFRIFDETGNVTYWAQGWDAGAALQFIKEKD